MKKLAIVVLALLGGLAGAAQWEFGGASSNEVTGSGTAAAPAELAIGRAASPTLWSNADGVAFEKNPAGQLISRKIAGGRAVFDLKFHFEQPLDQIRFTTPNLRGVDFSNGGCRFLFSVDGMDFQEMVVLNAASGKYRQGGDLAPVAGDWIGVPENCRDLVIRMEFDGYAGIAEWFGNGGILAYSSRHGGKARATVTIHPDHAAMGFLYFPEDRPYFSCDGDEVDTVTVVDLGRGGAARGLVLTRMGGRLLAELPELESGIYEIRFLKGCELLDARRIGIVPHPRNLDFAAKRRSPFGIVGISRRGGFRESAKLDGPAIGRMLGVHQERTGCAAWCEAGAEGPGKITFPPAGDFAETVIADGILRRGNLAWSPSWAVDPARVKHGEWPGHYPPRPEYLSEYAAFCQAAAEHYRGIIIPEYEIWNEPNNEPYGSFKGTFDEFVAMSRTAAEAVHAVQPEARMILGTTGDSDVGYIVRLLKAGLSKHFALVDIHPYRHTNQGPEDGLLGDITRLRRAIDRYGDRQGIIFSEVGWPTTRIDTPSYQRVSEFEQAVFNTRTLLISLAAGVERIHFHMLEDWGSDPDCPEHHFGFFRLDGSPKLAAVAMGAATRLLEGAEFLGRAETPEYLHVWYWRTPLIPDGVMATVWSDAQRLPDAPLVTLPGKPRLVSDVWGATPVAGRVAASGDGVTVKPGADPLFLLLETAKPDGIKPLPPDLRPNPVKRALSKRGGRPSPVDYGKLAFAMIPAQSTRAMAGAGIGDSAPAIGETPENVGSFDSWYDESGFTIAVNVRSGKPMKNDQSGWWLWAGDSLRLFMGNSAENFLDGNLHQICIAPTTAERRPDAVLISYDASSGLTAGDRVQAEITATDTPEGWAMAVTIPWSFFGAVPKPGDVWRFDLALPGAMWNNRKGDKWNNPAEWGEIQFM